MNQTQLILIEFVILVCVYERPCDQLTVSRKQQLRSTKNNRIQSKGYIILSHYFYLAAYFHGWQHRLKFFKQQFVGVNKKNVQNQFDCNK